MGALQEIKVNLVGCVAQCPIEKSHTAIYKCIGVDIYL